MSPLEPAIGLEEIMVYARGPRLKPGSPAMDNTRMASFGLTRDVAFLFPYLNAVARDAELHPDCFRFTRGKLACVLYPRWGVFTPVSDRREAWDQALDLLDFLNSVEEQRKEIPPDTTLFRPKPVTRILKLLPLTNCGECGFPTCLAFAANLGKDRTELAQCPHIRQPDQERATYRLTPDGDVLSFNMKGAGRKLQQQSARIRALEAEMERFSRMEALGREAANQSLPTPLTKREIQVLIALGLGKTNTLIARELKISAHTVKSHVLHIFNKLGVNDRTQAAVWAARNGFL